MTTPAPSSLLTIADVAKRLKVAEITVRRWIKYREIIAHKIGRQWRISETDLDVFLRMRRGLNLMNSDDH
jgi:excisionase family DNA binding protein